LKPSTSAESKEADREQVLAALQGWIEERNYAGHEPYDVLNSPWFSGAWARQPLISSLLIQTAKRVGGLRLRHLLRVPESHNPKALALVLSAYCDLARSGEECRSRARQVKEKLLALRSPNEVALCWGYDWHYVSLRGATLAKFSPNCIATCFGGMALLDCAEVFGDGECNPLAQSVAPFILERLNRSFENERELCLSYTPHDRTLIFNSSVLAGAFLARLGAIIGREEYLHIARKTMQFLVARQRANGSWPYGLGRLQGWVDGFHTGYNLGALLTYKRLTGERDFDENISRGYEYYANSFFAADSAPKYFDDSLYPIDIHSCSQAVITFCEFADRNTRAGQRARDVLDWTLANMWSGSNFYYQKHRLWIDCTPYMRWGQAWMFRAMARFKAQHSVA
jgi:hypothetical protein